MTGPGKLVESVAGHLNTMSAISVEAMLAVTGRVRLLVHPLSDPSVP